jgi:very-short-patch-repair endonuclease
MARKIESYRARTPAKFQLPGIPKKGKFAEAVGSFNPAVKQGVVDSEFMRRYNEWRSSSPAYQAGSIPEFIVWEYLTKKKNWHDGVDFKYQYNLFGGRTKFGGFVLDFFIVRGQIAINVQGLKYHLERVQDRAKVQLQDAMLAGRGFRVISVWEDDLLERPDYAIEAALRGQATNRHTDDVGFLR